MFWLGLIIGVFLGAGLMFGLTVVFVNKIDLPF